MINPQTERPYDLELRLLEYSSQIIAVTEALAPTRAGNHIGGQLLRCGTSPYANHGEAEAAESRDDFIHKLRICLKELRESQRWLRLIRRSNLHPPTRELESTIGESDQLIRIFVVSIRTARRNGQIAETGSGTLPNHGKFTGKKHPAHPTPNVPG